MFKKIDHPDYVTKIDTPDLCSKNIDPPIFF